MGRERKTVIAGTGRCGTTCLIQLLTNANLDTGFRVGGAGNWRTNVPGIVVQTDPKDGRILKMDRDHLNPRPVFSGKVNAGCETLICPEDTYEFVSTKIPEVIKDPRLAWVGHELIDAGILKIRHMIVCIRELEHVAKSKTRGMDGHDTGKWYQHSFQKTYDISAWQLGVCVAEMTVRQVPMTFLEFPRFVQDVNYFLLKMLEVFPDTPPKVLHEAWNQTADVNLVHYPDPSKVELGLKFPMTEKEDSDMGGDVTSRLNAAIERVSKTQK